MQSIHRAALAVGLAAGVGVLSSCAIDIDTSRHALTEQRSIDLDKSEAVRVELRMGAGELHVRGGSSKLMDADFSFRDQSRPEVRYDSSDLRGHLVVEEPSHRNHITASHTRWNLRLNDEKPLDMQVDFGAGEGDLDLGTLTLRGLEVHMGVGQLRIDLRGTPKSDYNVTVHGGVGEVTVYLPDGVGIVANATGGIGGVNARGLQKRDGRYVNDSYGGSKVTVRLDITGGIGAINLVGG